MDRTNTGLLDFPEELLPLPESPDMRCSQIVILFTLWMGCAGVAVAEQFALLVGCSKYPSLDESWQLEGPVNDVALLRHVLRERLGIRDDNVVTLSEASEQGRPTRARIEQEFMRLVERVREGDEVIILLAGHGTQQADNDPTNRADFEPDGLDEVFCPADIRAIDANDEARGVPNGIVDDELGAWLDAIVTRGASVWIIIDACHSGTMIRGNNQERPRQLPSSVLFPEAAVKKRRKPGTTLEQTRGASGRRAAVAADDQSRELLLDQVVALYAAQPFEVTIEKQLPANTPDAKPHGLLTYTVCQVLAQTRGRLSYRDLVSRVHGAYVRMGRSFPTPLLEGRGIDRNVVEPQIGDSQIFPHLRRDQSRRWVIDVGQIHGMTVGDVLAVRGEQQSVDDSPIGHVRVSQVNVIHSVVEPYRYQSQRAPAELTAGSACELVFRDAGLRRLKIAIDGQTVDDSRLSTAERTEILQGLAAVNADRKSLVSLTSTPEEADWLIRARNNSVVLIPASGWADGRSGADPEMFGPAEIGPELGNWLLDRMRRIARAQNLLALTSATSSSDGGNARIAVQLVRLKNEDDREGEPIRWDRRGVSLHKGDLVAFRVTNDRPFSIDLTLLFVDAAFGISSYFPEPGTADNRLRPKQTLLTLSAEITDETIGLEHMVAIAVKAEPQRLPVDFSYLAQPALERTRAADGPAIASPLGQLLNFAMYGEGQTRGLARKRPARKSLPDHALGIVSWRAVP